MFQTNKNSYQIIAVCTNDEKEGRYTLIQGPDDDWGEIAEKMFFDEFGVYPTEVRQESIEKL